MKARYGFGRNFNIAEIADKIIGLINPDAPVISLFGHKVIDIIPDITFISDDEMQGLKEVIAHKGYNVQETKGGLLIYK